MESLMMILQEAAPQLVEEAAKAAPDQSHAHMQDQFYSVGAGLFILGAVAILQVATLGILFLTMAVAPNLSSRVSGALRERNIRSFFVGAPIGGILFILLLIGLQAPLLFAITAVIGGVGLLLGLSAASEDIGRRVYWACGKEGSRAAHLASGWLVFSFSCWIPILGWIVIPAYVVLSGLGSIVVSAFRKDAPKDVEFKD